jgi:hypothetical protein
MQLIKATKCLLSALAMTLIANAALADGVVTELAGTLTATRAGEATVLSKGSTVKQGDTITTEKGAYAQIKFSDGAVMTVKPGTRFVIQEQHFSEAEPEKDASTFSLLKGGLRTVSGLIGKRGNRDAYKMNTATATIGIRGTVFDVDDCASSQCVKGKAKLDDDATNNTTSSSNTGSESDEVLVPAIYVGVHDGEVVVKNAAGELTLSAGQFGIAPTSNLKPTQLPGDPGLSQITSLGNGRSVLGDGFAIRNCR